MSESKEATSKIIYENPASGYNSVRNTYVQANKINPGIRYIDVKEYLVNYNIDRHNPQIQWV